VKPLNPLVLTVSVPPHRHYGSSVQGLMTAILMAMAPAAAMAVHTFGLDALRVMALSAGVAVLTEAACNKLMDRPLSVSDLHAFTVGLAFAFLLPASAPWWLVAFGSAASIGVGKMMFGPLGGSPFCAPLVGWAICRVSWPVHMDLDASMLTMNLTYALGQLKAFGWTSVQIQDTKSLLFGRQLGGLGAVQVAGVLVGGLYLVAKHHISSIIPVGFLAGVCASAWVLHLVNPVVYPPAMFHLLSGSVMFGAFFLATDGPSSPNRQIPMLFFGLLAGVMTIIIRVWGAYPDGVPFAILLANLFTPVLERIRPRPFGAR